MELRSRDHSASLGDSITSSTQIRFSVHTGFAIEERPPVLARGFFARMNGYILGLDHAGVWADAKKGNHWPRRMGYHGSVGNGAGRAMESAQKLASFKRAQRRSGRSYARLSFH